MIEKPELLMTWNEWQVWRERKGARAKQEDGGTTPLEEAAVRHEAVKKDCVAGWEAQQKTLQRQKKMTDTSMKDAVAQAGELRSSGSVNTTGSGYAMCRVSAAAIRAVQLFEKKDDFDEFVAKIHQLFTLGRLAWKESISKRGRMRPSRRPRP